jgi:hypothetical protein
VTPSAQEFQVGDTAYISSATPAAYATGSTGATVTATTGLGVGKTFTYTFSAGSDPGAITAMTCGPHPMRVGNWSVIYGVGSSGNMLCEVTGIGAAGTFPQEFAGLCTLQPTLTPDTNTTSLTCATNAASYPAFNNRQSYNGSSNGNGGGNYALLGGSPGQNLQKDWLLNFDLSGQPRTAISNIGCFATVRPISGRPRQGILGTRPIRGTARL